MDRTYVILPDSGKSSSLCRLCAQNHENYVNIFISNGVFKSTIEQAILDLINIKVFQGDGLPCVACIECVGKLVELRDFKVMCLMSDKELRKSAVDNNVKCIVKEEELGVAATTQGIQDASDFCNPNMMTAKSCIKEEVDWNEATEEEDDIGEGDVGKDMSVSVDQLPVKKEWDEMMTVEEEILPDQWLENGGKVSCVSIAQMESSASAYPSIPRDPLALDSLEMESEYDRNEVPCKVRRSQVKEDGVKQSTIEPDAMDRHLSYKCDKETGLNSANKETSSEFNRVLLTRVDTVGDSSAFSCDGYEDHVPLSVAQIGDGDQSLRIESVMVGVESRNKKRLHSDGEESTEQPEKTYECNVCLKTFTRNNNLRGHMRVHTGEKPYECNVCSKSFTRNDTLRSHMRIHSGEKPYECDLCGKTFSHDGSFRHHRRVHTGEKPFNCSLCSKSFSRTDILREHMRTHTGDRPFQCQLCPKAFSQSGTLRTHMIFCHNEKQPESS